MTMRLGSLCSGSGLLDAGVARVLDVEHAWFAENDPAASKVLAARFPHVANLGDLTAVDWEQIAREQPVDAVTFGFSCQDISCAGRKAGMGEGTRSGVWSAGVDAITALRPRLVVIENVAALLSTHAQRTVNGTDRDVEPGPPSVGNGSTRPVLRALGAVLGDLATIGFDAEWQSVPASAVGTAHRRDRVFIVAWPADSEGIGLRHRGSEGGTGLAPAVVAGGAGPDGVTLLPTPRTNDAKGPGLHGEGGPDLRTAVSLLPTPTVRDATRGMGWGQEPGRPLSETISRLLPTPAARLADKRGFPSTDTAATRMWEEGRRNLEDAVALLPTPRATDGTNGGPNQRGSSGDLMLPSAVVLLPTPTATPYGNNQSPSDGAAIRPSLDSLAVADRWGNYGAAIARWESVLDRPAPDPTEPGRLGQPRLSARFVEWLMGWPDGWVTAVPGLSRNDQLRICGNGVVPQQAAHAVAVLLDRLRAEAAAPTPET